VNSSRSATLPSVEHLSEAQRSELRAALVAERDALAVRRTAQSEEAVGDQEVHDVQDDAAEENRRSQALDRNERDGARLAEVEAALRRMDDGTYGICEETGEEIPFARLRAEPTTRYTVEALEMLEEERDRARLLGPDEESPGY
jgi:DnaK suppressor protein